MIICRCEQNVLLNISLKFRFINKTTAKVILVWNFDLRIFSVYGHGAWFTYYVSLCFWYALMSTYLHLEICYTDSTFLYLQDVHKTTAPFQDTPQIQVPTIHSFCFWTRIFLKCFISLKHFIYYISFVRDLRLNWGKTLQPITGSGDVLPNKQTSKNTNWAGLKQTITYHKSRGSSHYTRFYRSFNKGQIFYFE